MVFQDFSEFNKRTLIHSKLELLLIHSLKPRTSSSNAILDIYDTAKYSSGLFINIIENLGNP